MVVLTTGAAIAYVATADKVYEAEADLIIFPVPPAPENLVNLPLIQGLVGSDPRRRDGQPPDHQHRGRRAGQAGHRLAR